MSDPSHNDLISDVIEEVATPEQMAQFEALLKSDPGFAATCQRHLGMTTLIASLNPEKTNDRFVASVIGQARSISNEGEHTFLENLRQRNKATILGRRWIAGGIAAAACLAFALFSNHNPASPTSLPSQALASVTLFEDGTTASPIRRITSPETLQLTRGRAKIQFSSGSVIALEAPATLKIRDAMNVDLMDGRLNGWCPPSAHGFRVKTPKASLVDLGTSFGVHLEGDKDAEFVVFDGLVQIENSDQKTLLHNGHSLRLGPAPREIPFEGSPYKQTWLLAEGIVMTTGAVVAVEPDTPEGIASQSDDFHVLVSPESRNVPLTRDLTVDLIKPGSFSGTHWNVSKGLLLSQAKVKDNLTSYLIHARVERPLKSKTDHVHYQGSVTFAEPVVAIVTSQILLKNCDDLFATGPWKNVKLPINNRGLESNMQAPSDKITLSGDRLTVTIDFHTGYGIDEVRVITASPVTIP